MSLIIKGGFIIDPASGYAGEGSVFIENGVVTCVETEKGTNGMAGAKNFKTIDAKGKWAVPGLIDLHVHFREPGFEYKEDIKSGCMAAKKGGFTKVCLMPNTKPVVDCAEVVSFIKDKAKAVTGVEVFVVGAVTKGQAGKELADIEGMRKAGICAISEDGKSVMNSGLMREAMLLAKSLGIPYFSHAEDENLPGAAIGEELIVARDILLAKETGARLHLCHISTRGGAELIRRAKADGINVTAETAPHYFTLSASDVKRNGNRKMNPPLRSADDVLAIKEALADGTIDAIATDHAPHAREEKETEFEKALNGVIGLETSFAISYTELVRAGILSPVELIRKMSYYPARILGIKPPCIKPGEKAELILIDIENEHVLSESDLASKSANSPFLDMSVYGRPVFLNEIWE